MESAPDMNRLLCHAEWLGRLARSLVSDAALADDLVQETWIAAIRRPPDPARPARPWLAGVLRKLARLRMRREGVRAAHAPPGAGAAPAADETALQVERQRALAGLVLALEEPYRSTLLLHYYRGLSAARIARDLGIPSATVRTRLKRGLARLREDLDRASGGDGRSWVSALAPLVSLHSGALSTGALLLGGSIMAKWIAGAASVVVVLAGTWWVMGRMETAEQAPRLLASPAEREASAADPGTTERVAGSADESTRESAVTTDSIGAVTEALPANDPLLTVRVVARGSRQPLEATWVYVLLEEDWARGGSQNHWAETDPARLNETVVTKADGIARFGVLAGKRLHLKANGDWRQVGTMELVLDALDPGETRELVVELPVGPDLRFVGRVLDDVTGAPLADVPVVVREYAETRTDPEGYFVVDGLSWGRQHALIDASGYGLTLTVLVTGHATREEAQVVRLLRAASLLSQVEDSTGAPLEGREIVATTGFTGLIRPRTGVGDTTGSNPKWSAKTDENGRAVLEGIPPGVDVQVELREGGMVVRSLEEGVRLAPGERREVEFSLGTGTRVFGLARDESGLPAGGLEVWLRPTDVERGRYFNSWDGRIVRQRATTDANGEFDFADVPAGEWLVGPRWKERGPAIDALEPAPLATLVSTSDLGGVAQVDLVIARGHFLRARLLGADGEPRHGYWVRLESDELDGVLDYKTDADGRIVAGPLVRGFYAVQGHGSGADRDSAVIEAPAGQEQEITLVLERGAEIRGRTLDARTGEGCAAETRLIPELEPGSYAGWVTRRSRETSISSPSCPVRITSSRGRTTVASRFVAICGSTKHRASMTWTSISSPARSLWSETRRPRKCTASTRSTTVFTQGTASSARHRSPSRRFFPDARRSRSGPRKAGARSIWTWSPASGAISISPRNSPFCGAGKGSIVPPRWRMPSRSSTG